MKQILLSFFILLVFTAADQQSIGLTGLQSQYQLSDSISFSLENTDTCLYYFYVGLEQKVKGEWQEVVLDASNAKAKAARLLKVPAHENHKFHLALNGLLAGQKKPAGEYRFRVNYRRDVLGQNSMQSSATFRVKK